MVDEEDFALALLNINMRAISGLELACHLQAKSTVLVTFSSTNKDEHIVRRAVDCGAIGFLVKPIDPESLIPAVTSSLALAEEILKLQRSEANLTSALAAGRENSIAVGLLMPRHHANDDTAFSVLCDYARSNRCKLNEVANELLEAEELDHAFSHIIGRALSLTTRSARNKRDSISLSDLAPRWF